MATTGNTIRLTIVFTDWDGLPVGPTAIALKVYDAEHIQVGTTINLTVAHKTVTGTYVYDYVVPAGNDPLYVEASGTASGTTVLGRAQIIREFYTT